jgi:hypothetical protein
MNLFAFDDTYFSEDATIYLRIYFNLWLQNANAN